MFNENIFKVWGERRRIFLSDHLEIDLLHIKKDHFCSTHNHKHKFNKFVVVSGQVRIESEYGNNVLLKNESWTVEPPRIHRFVAEEDSTMIEIAFVAGGNIDPDDINRISLGGKIIDGTEYTIDQLKEKGLLEL